MSARGKWVFAALVVVSACAGTPPPRANGTDPAPASTSNGSGSPAPTEPHSGMTIHVENVQITGALPNEPSPTTDRLDVSFEIVMTHTGTSALTGISVSRARLVDDNGHEVVAFGVLGQDWDGRLDAGGSRTVAFHKTPDSAVPHPTHALCGLAFHLEITVLLGAREAHAASRHVRVACTAS